MDCDSYPPVPGREVLPTWIIMWIAQVQLHGPNRSSSYDRTRGPQRDKMKLAITIWRLGFNQRNSGDLKKKKEIYVNVDTTAMKTRVAWSTANGVGVNRLGGECSVPKPESDPRSYPNPRIPEDHSGRKVRRLLFSFIHRMYHGILTTNYK